MRTVSASSGQSISHGRQNQQVRLASKARPQAMQRAASLGTAARRIPDKDSLHTVAVTSRGNPRSKEEAFAGLEDALCRAILESIRS